MGDDPKKSKSKYQYKYEPPFSHPCTQSETQSNGKSEASSDENDNQNATQIEGCGVKDTSNKPLIHHRHDHHTHHIHHHHHHPITPMPSIPSLLLVASIPRIPPIIAVPPSSNIPPSIPVIQPPDAVGAPSSAVQSGAPSSAVIPPSVTAPIRRVTGNHRTNYRAGISPSGFIGTQFHRFNTTNPPQSRAELLRYLDGCVRDGNILYLDLFTIHHRR